MKIASPVFRLEAWLPLLVAEWRGRNRRAPSSSPAGSGEKSLGDRELAGISEALLRLQRGLTGERQLLGGDPGNRTYMDSPEMLGAYLLYYWAVSFLETSLSLDLIDRPAFRVLDLGAGPGPASAAFLGRGARHFVLVDGSAEALSLAKNLLAGGAVAPVAAAGVATLQADLARGLPPLEGPFDAIVASKLLNELWKDEADRIARRVALVETAAAHLASGGFVLVIEPATLAASRDALALRDALCARGWHIAGPCTHSGTCPALAAGPARSCHGQAAWTPGAPMAELAAGAGLDRSSVKWSWFACLPPGSGERPANKASPGAKAIGERLSGRVVSDGMLNKAGRLRYAVCTSGAEPAGDCGPAGDCEPGGSLVTLSARSGSPEALAAGFASLRRHDLLTVEGAERREGGLGLVPTTKISVTRAPAAHAPAAHAPGVDG
ncbi:MAG: small ribosomal subunit Rsm22 family protein [Spirochaetota bacterium]